VKGRSETYVNKVISQFEIFECTSEYCNTSLERPKVLK